LPLLELENQHHFKFCTLPGIILLKLIAWDDRPEIRRDDIKDISDILRHFFDMYDNEIWDNHNDLFENENANLLHIAARVMGREMGQIAGRNAKILTRIEGILHANTVDIRTSKIAVIMVEYFKNTVEDNVVLLEEIKRGVLERGDLNEG
jgi:predicted nucleotidyltransferase